MVKIDRKNQIIYSLSEMLEAMSDILEEDDEEQHKALTQCVKQIVGSIREEMGWTVREEG